MIRRLGNNLKAGRLHLIEFVVVCHYGFIGRWYYDCHHPVDLGKFRSRSQMQAVQRVEYTGQWLTRDVQMSKTVTPDTASASQFVLTWSDHVNTYEATYFISGDQLIRSYKENSGSAEQKIMVQSLDTDSTGTNCSYAGGVLTITITAKVGKVRETRTYQIQNRPV